MEEKVLKEFKLIYFGKMIVYPDRVEIKSLFKNEIIPAGKIANVSHHKISGKFIIETTGGSQTLVYLWGGWDPAAEAMRLITSLNIPS
jgi:hypothetical protein